MSTSAAHAAVSARFNQFDHEFKVEFQPLIALSGQHFVGFEALLTWQDQRRDLYSTATLQMLDETGLALAARSWLLRTVTRQLYFWNKQFLAAAHLGVSLQLSAKQWLAPGLPEALWAIGRDFRWRIQGLIIEIDQSVLLHNVHWSMRLVSRLQAMGVEVQVRNFAPTYAAIATLSCFNIGLVKLDQAFLRNLTLSPGAQSGFAGVLQELTAAGIQVTVPCIESPAQVELLSRLECSSWRAVCATPISSREATLLIHADSKLAQLNVNTYLSAMNRLSDFIQQFLGRTLVERYWHSTCPSSDWLQSTLSACQTAAYFQISESFSLSACQVQDIEQWVEHFVSRCSRIVRDLPALLKASGLTLAEAQLLRLRKL